MSDSPVPVRLDRVHDAVIPRDAPVGRRFWLVLLGFGVFGGTQPFLPLPAPLPVLVMIVLLLVFLVSRNRWEGALVRRRLRRLDLDSEPPDAALAQLAALLAPHKLIDMRVAALIDARHAAIRPVAERLCALGHVGHVFRIAFDSDALTPLPPPYDVPIEPAPLQQKPAALREYSGVEPPRYTRSIRDALTMIYGPFMRTRWTRWLMFGLIALGYTMLGFLALQAALEMLAGVRPKGLDALAAGLLGGSLILLWRAARSEQWLFLSGALLVRTSTWRRDAWTLHFFPRCESTIVYVPSLGLLAVTGPGGRSFSTTLHPIAAEVAVRAFLSPLDPPPLERMTDLL